MLRPEDLEKSGIFDPRTIALWVNQHLEGNVSRHKELWTLLAFETWRRGPYGPSGH